MLRESMIGQRTMANMGQIKTPNTIAGQAPSSTLHHDGVWTEAFYCRIDNRREQLQERVILYAILQRHVDGKSLPLGARKNERA